VFDYSETLYKLQRKHTNKGMQSPVDCEIEQQKMDEADV